MQRQRLGVALVGSLVLWSMGLMAVLLKRLLSVQLSQTGQEKRHKQHKKGILMPRSFLSLLLAKHYFSNDGF